MRMALALIILCGNANEIDVSFLLKLNFHSYPEITRHLISESLGKSALEQFPGGVRIL